ncbi:MAG: helix-turn-helix domain-containing protein [Actinomycetota bacterium]|nr:helix-turn-helix domain-containing protein [Actinomycetota bacterium]
MTIPTRRWAKTDATQQRILDAATEAFAVRGFTAATMADIVDGSGASVGSIYHHFGGKRELFLAIFDRLVADIDAHLDRTTDHLCDDRAAFEAGVRAYLDAIWTHRRVAAVLASGDTPAGFDGLRHSSMRSGLQRWAALLALDPSPRGQLLTRILTAIIAEASSLVILCDHRRDVALITDATIEAIGRVAG